VSPFSHWKRKRGDVQIAVFQYLTALLFLWLLAGFWQLQVRSPEVYAEQAERNRIKSLPLPAPRGKILDRDRRILVDNSPSFKALLSRAALDPKRLPVISEGLNIPDSELQTRLRRLMRKDAPEYQTVVIKENLTSAEVAFAESHSSELPELELIRSQRRLYAQEGLAAHAVGYVGEVSDEELQQAEFVLYEPGAEIGKSGIEKQYNSILSGKDGSRQVVVDSRGRSRGEFGIVPARPGRSIRLTIDLDLQVVGELAMEGRQGSVVALDPRNGEVLALVSNPTFEPNEFVGGISSSAWRRLSSAPDTPLLNRAIQAQLAPGSVFKPIVALAGLETGTVTPDFQVYCNGGASFYGRHFRCWKRGGHGFVKLYEALAHSCDVYFYTVGNKLGIDTIAHYARLVGLGQASGIDLPHEEEGTVPSSRWKVRFFREKWYAGETISVAVGQGALTATPLQLAYAIGGLAMGGVWHHPRLVFDEEVREAQPNFKRPEPRRADFRRENIDTVVHGLWGVVNDGGTGGKARLPGHEVCGKTGTAQRVSRELAQSRTDLDYADTAWFVGFAPCLAPEIVVVALFESGEHGDLAAPIVRDVLKAYFDKKERLDLTRQAPAEQSLAAARPPRGADQGREGRSVR
jgi:penicillin-binding protein 2